MSHPLRTHHFSNPPLRRFYTHFNFAFRNILCYNFYILQVKGVTARFPHTIFSFAIPNLLNFLVLKYQNQDKSPFETHSKTVSFGVVSVLFYCLAYDFQQRISLPPRPPVRASLVHHCLLFFGYMAIASLVSLLLPDSASPAIYVLHVTLAVGFPLLHLVYQRISKQFRGTRFQNMRNSPFFVSLSRIVAQRGSNQRHILPM